jgi:hypothetical protein
MGKLSWSITAKHFVNCNCDYGCPCQFNALPTHRNCCALVVWDIEEGYFGDVKLGGLRAINTYAWPGAIHEGNGALQTIVDERASKEQRQALNAVMQGKNSDPGQIMLAIYRSMCTTVHEPLFRPIELEINVEDRKATLRVPGLIDTEIEPILNPVTKAQHRARIDLPMGREYHLAEVASGRTRASGNVPLELTNTHAHLLHNTMTSGGVAA